ncbi:MAG: hypothetical protein ABL931_11390 [Usitatibacteraceae bacterium]
MKKLLVISGLTMMAGLANVAMAQEVGKVISSTPVTRDVGVPQSQCAPDAIPNDPCRSVTHFEKRTFGYNVVYEYAGKQYTAQLPEDPGPTVNLQISPAVAGGPSRRAASPPAIGAGSQAMSQPMYEERWDVDRDQPYRVLRSTEGLDADRDRAYTETVMVEPRYVERVYVSPSYYGSGPYYYPSYYGYYGSPILPVLGLSIGLSRGFRNYGGYYGGRHGR